MIKEGVTLAEKALPPESEIQQIDTMLYNDKYGDLNVKQKLQVHEEKGFFRESNNVIPSLPSRGVCSIIVIDDFGLELKTLFETEAVRPDRLTSSENYRSTTLKRMTNEL